MTARRGISILDLVGLPPGSQTLIPPDIAAQLEKLAVLDHRSTTSPGAYIHYGTVQSATDAGLPALRNWPVEAPGLNAGLPFQLTIRRTPLAAGQNLEPAPQVFNLDLFLDRIAIEVPGLRPARAVGGSGVTPAHLDRDPRRSKVRIVGGGVFRIAATAGGSTLAARFIDQPDPFDPAAPTGPVFTVGFDPPSFFFGDSSIGMTVDRLTYDDSPDFTPPEIVARGQPASWRGIAIHEATLYLPPDAPVVGDVSIGVRDVLLGSPFGLQGTVQIELGQSPVDPAVVQFFQAIAGTDSALATGGTATSRTVTLAAGTTATTRRGRVRAGLPTGGAAQARWVLPDHRELDAPATPYFEAAPGDVVSFRGLETSGTEQVQGQEYRFTFQEASATPQHAPKIDVTVGGTVRANVASVSGDRTALAGLTFQANPSATDLTWQLGTGAVPATGRGGTFSPAVPEVGTHLLVLRTSDGRERRIRVEVLEQGRLIAGSAAGAFDTSGQVQMREVESTWDLGSFHRNGAFVPAASDAVLASPTSATVPAGALAEVTLEAGAADTTPPAVPPPQAERHVQILMDFDSGNPIGWGDRSLPDRPYTDVGAWASAFAGATVLVVGRCDDIGPGNATQQRSYNRTLAETRAASGRALFPASVTVYARGEQSDWPAADATAAGAAETTAVGSGLITAAESTSASERWLIKTELPESSSWPHQRDAEHESRRSPYRRVDVYVVGGTDTGQPAQPQDDATLSSDLRRALVPGADATSVIVPAPREPTLPYRVRLVVAWDSPTVVELADAIPTLAELTVAWTSHALPLPSTTAIVTPTRNASGTPSTTPEIFTFVGRWTYDARSGETLFSLSISSAGDPNGLFFFGGTLPAVALGLGPALMAGVSSTDAVGAAVRLGGLVGAATIVGAVARDGKVAVFRMELQHRERALLELAGSRTRILFDYTVELGFNVPGPGFTVQTNSGKPLKVRYKNVGIEYDNSPGPGGTPRQWYESVGLVYENVSFEVEDPGSWTITGPLGELLRVTGTRAGSGSTWIEVDLRFALDLGVITITGATVRVTFDTSGGAPRVELRGLAVKVDIPGTVKGEGRMSLGAGGTLRAGLAVEVIPAKVAAQASLAIGGGMVALEVGVFFAAGIPLANTGLGVYGFVGRFVSNGTRDFTAVAHPNDPVQKEIDWYKVAPEQKYRPEPGQWALGLGAAVGTLPDAAFTFNALGMFTISFPDPSVVFGIDAKLIKPPAQASAGGPGATTGNLLGLIVVDPTAVKVGIRGSYDIPQLLHVEVPISAYFPLPGAPGDAYVRIGADGFEGRTGDPVTISLLPGTLDVHAWAYLMVEARSLHRLGGDDRFSFDGFSIGFGAGWGIEWSAGPFRLSASAKVLVGVGTHPLVLVAGVFVRGELSLVVVSVSVTGELVLKLTETRKRLDGRFCGHVDFFFFSVGGCVEIAIGDDFDADIPTPDHPLRSVDLTDRRAIVTGKAVIATPGAANTVWPDTVPVLHFAHYVATALSGSVFAPAPEIPGPIWSGTSELKYAYRLTGLDIVPIGGSPLAGPLESAWWLPSHRGGVLGGNDPLPSEQENRDLALMSWHPAPWARNLGSDGGAAPGDPSQTVGRVCDPPPRPVRSCVLGQNAKRETVDRVRLRPDPKPPPPGPSTAFDVLATESLPPNDLQTAALLAATAGLHLVPGSVRPLPAPFSPPGGPTALRRAYEVAHFDDGTVPRVTAGVRLEYVPPVVRPDLVLAIRRPKKGISVGGGDGTGPARETCDDFRDVAPGTKVPPAFQHGGLTYEDLAGQGTRTVDQMPQQGVCELVLPPKGMLVRLPTAATAANVHVALFAAAPVKVEALDGSGNVVATAASPSTTKVEHVVSVSGSGIVALRLTGGRGEAVLMRCCHTPAPSLTHASQPQLSTLLAPAAAATQFPHVQGTRTDGTTAAWKPAIVGKATAADGTVWTYVRYVAPGGRPWQDATIAPWPGGLVDIVSSCAVNWIAASLTAADQQARIDFQTIWNANAVGTATPTPRPLLDANRTYEIRVRCDWQGWRRTDSSNAPGPPSAGAWQSFPEQVYRFRTAAAAALATPPPPVDFFNEASFDARGIARYLIGFEPDGTGPPHFLDDPIRVRFQVEYLEQLLAKYGRRLVLKIRRTDQQPGALPGGATPPTVGQTIAWQPLEVAYYEHSDQRMCQAAEAAPCLDDRGDLGGTTAVIDADLEPDADYDLLLVAPLNATPDADEVLVARTHFHTSRYRDARELLEALGFTTPAYPLVPPDAVVSAALPTSGVLGSDRELDATLRTLGLDPWPLPPHPRTTTIWSKNGTWGLAAVLLESDEALERGTRLHVREVTQATAQFTPVRSNESGTRILLAAATPATVAAAGTIAVAADEPGATLAGERYVPAGPRAVTQELG